MTVPLLGTGYEMEMRGNCKIGYHEIDQVDAVHRPNEQSHIPIITLVFGLLMITSAVPQFTWKLRMTHPQIFKPIRNTQILHC